LEPFKKEMYQNKKHMFNPYPNIFI